MRKYVSLAAVALLVLSIVPQLGFSTLCDDCWCGCEPFVTDLIAGQSIDVGTVIVWCMDGSLHVMYVTDDGWLLLATHLYVGTDPPSDDDPKLFPYKHEDLGGVTTDKYEIPLSGLGLSERGFGIYCIPCRKTLYIAAHAVVYEVVGEGCCPPQWATNVDDYNQGTLVTGGPVTRPERMDPSAALGSPDGAFYSLGFVSDDDGYLTLSFEYPVFNDDCYDIVVYEVTFGRDVYPDEVAEVYVIVGGVEHYAGTVTNHNDDGMGMVSIPDSLLYVDAVKLVDNSTPSDFSDPAYENADGYDVDAVGACYLYHEENAWGEGEQFGEGWAMYFTYTIWCS